MSSGRAFHKVGALKYKLFNLERKTIWTNHGNRNLKFSGLYHKGKIVYENLFRNEIS